MGNETKRKVKKRTVKGAAETEQSFQTPFETFLPFDEHFESLRVLVDIDVLVPERSESEVSDDNCTYGEKEHKQRNVEVVGEETTQSELMSVRSGRSVCFFRMENGDSVTQ